MIETASVLQMKLPVIVDDRGNLSVFENNQHFPFEIQWVTWIGSSSLMNEQLPIEHNLVGQVIILFSGSMSIVVSDGITDQIILMDQSTNCIYISAGCHCAVRECQANTSLFIASETFYETSNPVIDFFTQKQSVDVSAPIYY